MAFETHIIALSWRNGNYAVVAQTTVPVNTETLEKDGLFNNVSENTSFIDEAAILHKNDFRKYLLPESDLFYETALEWYTSLPKETVFIIVHRAEWESCLADD